jgi:hypothetical protein
MNHFALMGISFSADCASGVFGSVRVKTPFWKAASILSRTTPVGSGKERWKEPYLRSAT